MVSSEYEGMKVLHSIVPEMVAEPIAWGAYKEEPDTYFFVCRYCELSDDVPSPSDFPALVAEMHRRSAKEGGEFGFPHTTFGGRNPQCFPPEQKLGGVLLQRSRIPLRSGGGDAWAGRRDDGTPGGRHDEDHPQTASAPGV